MISTFWKHAVEITTRLDFKWYHSQNTGQVYYQTSVVLDIPSKESAAALGHHGISRVIQVLAWCIPSLWAGRRARPAWPVAGGKSPIEILRDFVWRAWDPSWFGDRPLGCACKCLSTSGAQVAGASWEQQAWLPVQQVISLIPVAHSSTPGIGTSQQQG